MTTYATSGVDEDGTKWMTSGGPEHLTELHGRALWAFNALQVGHETPTAEQVSEARIQLRIIVAQLELAAGLVEWDDGEDEEIDEDKP